jgi:hypothetical protein
VLLVLIWLAGAVVATGVGVLAVRLVATQVGDPAVAPLSAGEAEAAQSTVPPSSVPGPSPGVASTAAPGASPAAGTTGPPPSSPAAAANVRAFPSAGGTVGMSCSGQVARLLYATPADGYTLDEQSATGDAVEVRFESDSSRVRLELTCRNGAPALLGERTDPARGGSGHGEDG